MRVISILYPDRHSFYVQRLRRYKCVVFESLILVILTGEYFRVVEDNESHVLIVICRDQRTGLSLGNQRKFVINTVYGQVIPWIGAMFKQKGF